jgi:hypothetical protein
VPAKAFQLVQAMAPLHLTVEGAFFLNFSEKGERLFFWLTQVFDATQ